MSEIEYSSFEKKLNTFVRLALQTLLLFPIIMRNQSSDSDHFKLSEPGNAGLLSLTWVANNLDQLIQTRRYLSYSISFIHRMCINHMISLYQKDIQKLLQRMVKCA